MSKSKKSNDTEQRMISPTVLKIRQDGEDSPKQIVGLVIPFGEVAEVRTPVGSFFEVFDEGSVTKTLQENDNIYSFWQHERASPLGRTGNDTVELLQDAVGLWAAVTPNPDTTFGADALASVERGDVNKWSFGFTPVVTDRERHEGSLLMRRKEIVLTEVSPVSMSVFQETVALARDDNEDPSEPPAETAAPAEPEGHHSGDVLEPEPHHSDGDAQADTRQFKERYLLKRKRTILESKR